MPREALKLYGTLVTAQGREVMVETLQYRISIYRPRWFCSPWSAMNTRRSGGIQNYDPSRDRRHDHIYEFMVFKRQNQDLRQANTRRKNGGGSLHEIRIKTYYFKNVPILQTVNSYFYLSSQTRSVLHLATKLNLPLFPPATTIFLITSNARLNFFNRSVNISAMRLKRGDPSCHLCTVWNFPHECIATNMWGVCER